VDQQWFETIEKALLGDAGACRAIYDAHARWVKAYFVRSGFPEADADDLVQETFLRALRSLGTYDPGRGAFRAWLATIARNAARRRWSSRPAPENFDPELAEEVLAAPGNPGETPEAREETAAVRSCVGELSAELQLVIRLRYVEGQTTRGIAAATKLPEATVRLRIEDARRRIEKCLRGKGVVD